jgi:SAM-dependent methyltransferase
MEGFDGVYSSVPDYFGAEPDPLLKAHFDLIDRNRPVLDIGCGQGRHAFYLARRGFSVDALDPSSVGLEQVARTASREALSIRTICGGFADLGELKVEYGCILIFGLIPLLNRDEIGELVETVEATLGPGGTLFLTAFGTWDPAYPNHESTREMEGSASFRSIDGSLGTFLEPGEIVNLFPFLEVLDHQEFLGPEHRHGDGPPERHGRAEAVLRRAAAQR